MCDGVLKSGSPTPSEMTPGIDETRSKNLRMPEGGIARTRSDTALRFVAICIRWPFGAEHPRSHGGRPRSFHHTRCWHGNGRRINKYTAGAWHADAGAAESAAALVSVLFAGFAPDRGIERARAPSDCPLLSM